MNVMISGSCDTPCEEADICDVYPRFGRSDSFLEVFGQSATPSQPCKCSLDHPSAWQGFETVGLIGALDDFQCKLSDLFQPASELGACISAVSKDMSQPRPSFEYGFQDVRCAIAILNTRRMDHQTNHQAKGINDNLTLTSANLLSRVKAPYSATFRGSN